MSKANPIIAPSLVARINDLRHCSTQAADAESLLQLAQLQPTTASYALIESARAAFDQNQPQAAFLFFFTAYLHHPEPDPRLLDWMARAARAQDQHPAADQLERLAKRERAAPPDAAQAQAAADQLSSRKLIARQNRLSSDETKEFRSRGLQLLAAPTRDPRTEPVEIIIPVYSGHQETLECIHSVLKAQSTNRTAHQLLVLDDAAPDRDLIAAIELLARQHASLSIVHHPVNLGFIRGVNRAMARQPNRDVIWLNADTRVLGDWVDRLQSWAYSAPKVASVTPFSNHGELMTFPNPRYRYPMPSPEQHAALDSHARANHHPHTTTPVSLPAGCGFCLYVRREAIADVGYLDEERLAGGYGEDTDWCLRAASRGWTHLAATNLFVAHHGSISFGDEKTWRVARNNAVIRKRFPNAERQFDHFVARNPLATARDQLQRARLAELAAWVHNALGPEPPLGSPHPHPRHLHRLGPRGVADPSSLFFASLPDHQSTPRTAPPGLLSISLRNLGRGPEILLSAALPGLALELTYRVDEKLDRLENDLRQLPLQGLVQHDPNQTPDALSERLQRLQLKSASIQSPALKQPLRQAQASLQLPTPSPHLALHPRPTQLTQQTPEPQTAYLIADPLHDPQVQRAWLSLARTCALQHSAPWLLVLYDKARLPELMATGRVLSISELPGLNLGTLLTLSGCQAALTLNPVDSASTTLAHTLANRLDLPLRSVIAQESAAPDSEFTTMIQPLRQKPQINGSQETATSMKNGTPTDESSSNGAAPQPAAQKTFLNIGCGNMSADRLPPLFRTGNWREIRLDIDPTVNADIVTHSADLSALGDASVAAAYSSHTLEHLEPHQVPIALREIHRVLEADGFVLITLPDIQAVAQLVVDGKLTEAAYESPVGPITALDMLYGHRDSLAQGNRYMAHQTGFDGQHLGESLLAAGFAEVRIRKGRCFDLWAFAFKQKLLADPPWLAFPLADAANAT